MNVKKLFLLFVGLSLIPSNSRAWDINSFLSSVKASAVSIMPFISETLNKHPYAASAVAGLATMYLASPYLKTFLSRNDSNAFCDAIVYGNLKEVAWFIRFGANINQKDRYDRLPLHTAVQEGHIEIVKLLINAGADVHIIDNYNSSPLYWAIFQKDKLIMELLIKRGANINVKKNVYSLLHFACYNGQVEAMELLIKKGVDVNAKDIFGGTPLHIAACNGQVGVMKLLIKNDADVNAVNKKNMTILNSAIKSDNIEAVKLLINAGADVNIADDNGCTPLHIAILRDCLEIIMFLIENSANANIIDEYGNTLLHWAICKDNIEIIKNLITMPIVFQNSELEKFGLEPATPLTKLASDCLIKNATEYDDDAKKMILKNTILLKDQADVTIAYGRDPETYNSLSDEEKNRFVRIVIAKHLLIIQQMIRSRNKIGETILSLAQEKNENDTCFKLLNNINEAKEYGALDEDLRGQIETNYKKLLIPTALLELD